MRKTIEIGTVEESARRFVETFHRLQRGESVPRRDILTFDDLDTLLRVLTPMRWTLLRTLRRKGPLSVRQLAQTLRRDYKNVHTDVGHLERVGLVSRVKDQRVHVPWKRLLADVHLDAA
jgi:predicted transcriptional regulator